ncbi:transcription initiation factor TFIID subunit 12 isoform X2 [Anabrus simplex]|uniref:transcription initiation factor TFIID subunit 12 isoform X2 n=1 Tax=Anabrus simplex TaxID=316456 RepID=UPI0034DD65E7
MSANISGNTIGQVQNIVTKSVVGTTQPTMITMSAPQQHQILTPNVNAVKMEIDSGIKTQYAQAPQTVMATQSMPNMSTSPSPGLVGNLQSIGTTASASTTLSPLQQSNTTNIMSSSSPSALGSQVKNSASSASSTTHDNIQSQILTRPRLQDLVREVDPTEQLDEEVEELLLQLADDFVESTVGAACLLAKHRRSTTVEVKDVQLHLERHWNMWLPGFGTDELRPYKRAVVTEAHKQRLALIRKALKKY